MTWRRSRVIAAFAALLVPVYWLPSVQSVDLCSHLYNAWLTLLVERGQAPGLAIVPQWTNFLFNVMLVELLRYLESEWACRLAVSAAVLVFNAGVYLLLRNPQRGYPWALFPFQAMFSYGFVYQIGFFNFYLSLGIGLIARSLLVGRFTPLRAVGGGALLAVGILAHALPVLWAGGIACFFQIYRRLRTGAGSCLRRRGWRS